LAGNFTELSPVISQWFTDSGLKFVLLLVAKKELHHLMLAWGLILQTIVP
jgi:hypothetical protein